MEGTGWKWNGPENRREMDAAEWQLQERTAAEKRNSEVERQISFEAVRGSSCVV